MSDVTGLSREYAERIRALAAGSDVCTRVASYLDPTSHHAAYSFDTAGANPAHHLTTDDLLALNFLDAPIGPMAYRRLVELQPEVGNALRKLSPDLHLWHVTATDQAYRDAVALWDLLMDVADLGHSEVSKLMARKRPKLVPIRDEPIDSFYGDAGLLWLPLGQALRDEGLRASVDAMRPRGMDTGGLSLLRILDIAIRMTHGHPRSPGRG